MMLRDNSARPPEYCCFESKFLKASDGEEGKIDGIIYPIPMRRHNQPCALMSCNTLEIMPEGIPISVP